MILFQIVSHSLWNVSTFYPSTMDQTAMTN